MARWGTHEWDTAEWEAWRALPYNQWHDEVNHADGRENQHAGQGDAQNADGQEHQDAGHGDAHNADGQENQDAMHTPPNASAVFASLRTALSHRPFRECTQETQDAALEACREFQNWIHLQQNVLPPLPPVQYVKPQVIEFEGALRVKCACSDYFRANGACCSPAVTIPWPRQCGTAAVPPGVDDVFNDGIDPGKIRHFSQDQESWTYIRCAAKMPDNHACRSWTIARHGVSCFEEAGWRKVGKVRVCPNHPQATTVNVF